jgi:hypothetical protein
LDDVIEYPEFVETDPLIPNTEDFRGLQKMRWKSMEIPAGNSMEIGPVFGFSTH